MTKVNQSNIVYHQKSKLFLYPCLGIPRGGSVTPSQTYLRWNKLFTTIDKKLICVFPLRTDHDFVVFERDILKDNPLFHSTYKLNETYGAYVFDFAAFKEHEVYDCVLSGKYSEIDEEYKKRILQFYSNNKHNQNQIKKYLYPKGHYGALAEDLTLNTKRDAQIEKSKTEKILQEVGELCSRPDMKKETLEADHVSLEVVKKELTLP